MWISRVSGLKRMRRIARRIEIAVNVVQQRRGGPNVPLAIELERAMELRVVAIGDGSIIQTFELLGFPVEHMEDVGRKVGDPAPHDIALVVCQEAIKRSPPLEPIAIFLFKKIGVIPLMFYFTVKSFEPCSVQRKGTNADCCIKMSLQSGNGRRNHNDCLYLDRTIPSLCSPSLCSIRASQCVRESLGSEQERRPDSGRQIQAAADGPIAFSTLHATSFDFCASTASRSQPSAKRPPA